MLYRLTIRHLRTTYDLKPALFVSLLIPNLMYIGIAAFAYNAIIQPFEFGGREINYISFFIPGIILIQIITLSSLGGAMFWTDKYNGMLEQLFSFPFPRSYYFLTRMLALLTSSVATGLTLLLIIIPLILNDLMLQPYSFPLLFGSISICSLIFGFLSMFIYLTAKTPDRVTVFTRLLTTPIIIASSVFYPVTYAPYPIKEICQLNPLTYCANLLRASLFGTLSYIDVYGGFALLLLAVTIVVVTRVYFEKVQIS